MWELSSSSIIQGLFSALIFLASVYMSEEAGVEMQTWMYMQDVSYLLPIVCPSLGSLAARQ